MLSLSHTGMRVHRHTHTQTLSSVELFKCSRGMQVSSLLLVSLRYAVSQPVSALQHTNGTFDFSNFLQRPVTYLAYGSERGPQISRWPSVSKSRSSQSEIKLVRQWHSHTAAYKARLRPKLTKTAMEGGKTAMFYSHWITVTCFHWNQWEIHV